MNDSVRLERFVGAGLMAMGAVLAALSGACTLAIAGGFIFSLFERPQSAGMALTLLLNGELLGLFVGVAPTLVGVFIFRAGLRRYRAPPRAKARGPLSISANHEPSG